MVVVSAMGKTTNKLLAIADAPSPASAAETSDQLHELRDFHSREARQVVPLEWPACSSASLDEHFQELAELVKGLAVLGELTPRSIDAISSYGERLSSLIVALAFRHFGMDAVARGCARGDRHRPPPHAGRAALSGDLRAAAPPSSRRWPRSRWW